MLFDAYECGVPVVVTDVGAIGPTVRADGSGWVVPPDDAHAFAEAVSAAHDANARRMARSRTVAAAREHDVVNVGRILRRVYEQAERSYRAAH